MEQLRKIQEELRSVEYSLQSPVPPEYQGIQLLFPTAYDDIEDSVTLTGVSRGIQYVGPTPTLILTFTIAPRGDENGLPFKYIFENTSQSLVLKSGFPDKIQCKQRVSASSLSSAFLDILNIKLK